MKIGKAAAADATARLFSPGGNSLSGADTHRPQSAPVSAAPARSLTPLDGLDRQELCVTFVDIVGYSAMMQADEGGTFRKWTDLRENLLIPLIASFDGIFVKSMGDGIIATFRDPLSAARWSHEVQKRARERRQGLTLRIALNFCHVIEDGEDLAGDGVNIAARLQELAAPGGVIVTDTMFERISGHPDLELRPLGPLTLRKLTAPVVAYELVTDGRPPSRQLQQQAQIPSIAVLPLQNLGGDREDDYFATGLVEDIIVSLASLRELFVISRSSTIAFAQQAIEPRNVGRVLGVRYVITGTLRRAPGRLRISTELLDTETGESVFSDRRDFTEEDTFRIQDEIVERIVARIVPHLHAAERRRGLRKRPESFTAFDSCLRALDLIGSLDREQFDQAYVFLNRSVKQDPRFAMPLAWSARWHTLNVGQGWSTDRRHDALTASERALQAISLDKQNALALATYGHVQSYLFGEFETAIGYLDRARETSPNSAIAWLLSCATLSYLGRNEEAVRAAQRALRLSPFDHSLYNFYAFLGLVHYGGEDHGAAIKWLSRALAENPRYTSSLKTLAASLAATGRIDEARPVAAKLIKFEPGFRLASYRETHLPYRDAEQSSLFLERLRLAGVPD